MLKRDEIEAKIMQLVRYLKAKYSRKQTSLSVQKVAAETHQEVWEVVRDREAGRLAGFNYYDVAKYIVERL
ncbi:MAG: hypothetical protein PHE73_03475 [Sulfurovaceae bacterium]|nr:hypothetical protein [Sulfurovaceae bacterium]